MYGPRTYKYTFESPEPWMAEKFHQILVKSFRVNSEEVSITKPWVGVSYITFWCTKKVRQRLEYVFRESVRLNKLYLMDLDTYQGNAHKIHKDHYMIY